MFLERTEVSKRFNTDSRMGTFISSLFCNLESIKYFHIDNVALIIGCDVLKQVFVIEEAYKRVLRSPLATECCSMSLHCFLKEGLNQCLI